VSGSPREVVYRVFFGVLLVNSASNQAS